MKITQHLAWMILVAAHLLIAACVSRATLASPPTQTSPAQTARPATATASASVTPASRAAPIAATATATTVTRAATATIAATAAPTAVPTAIEEAEEMGEVEECRKACHAIDINALFGLGAKRQPANHKTYTVCLECHAPLAKPALPATHLGRQDAACPLCHLVK